MQDLIEYALTIPQPAQDGGAPALTQNGVGTGPPALTQNGAGGGPPAHTQNGGAAGPPVLTQNGVGSGPPAHNDAAVVQPDFAPAMISGEWFVTGALAVPFLIMAIVVAIQRRVVRKPARLERTTRVLDVTTRAFPSGNARVVTSGTASRNLGAGES